MREHFLQSTDPRDREAILRIDTLRDRERRITMKFSVEIKRTKMPLRFRKRIAFRNHAIRLEVSGYPNYERLWAFGFEAVLEWGSALVSGKATKAVLSTQRKCVGAK